MRGERQGRLALWLVLAVVGCSSWRTPPLPVADRVVRDQLVLYSDFEVPQKDRLLAELEGLRRHVSEQLQLSSSGEAVHVYLFKTPRRYRAFMQKHFDRYPPRRALFVKTDNQLNVYAQWGNHVAEDLRHEVCHGYLHAAMADLPLWLDEGLAEYFEVPQVQQGLNSENLAALQELVTEPSWMPDLMRLERLQTIDDLDRRDYAESWAWVHFLLHSEAHRRELLKDYLRQLQEGRPQRPFSERLGEAEPEMAVLLRQHVRRLVAGAGVR
ncbi:MAG: DUF1570 domain-containing protein [Planctomycetales bacterium]|nr:DUF1570 domain-containing protein [Planctomycetales bacterium]